MADNRANNPFKESPWPRDPYKWAGEMGIESGPVPIHKWRPTIVLRDADIEKDPSNEKTRAEPSRRGK